MSAIKLYLIIGKNSQLEEIITFRDLDSLKQEWSDRSDTGKTAIIHCGFLRPRIDIRMELPENLSGKVLYSGAMKWALPEIYNSSVDTVMYIEMDNVKTPCYLALNQWGYEVEEQEITSVLANDDYGYNDSQGEQNEFHISSRDNTDINALVNSILSYSVERLNLTIRSRNCIRAQNIRYIGEVAQLTEDELLRFPNLGKTSVTDIKEALTEYGLSLGTILDGWMPPGAGSIPENTINDSYSAYLDSEVSQLSLKQHVEKSLNDLDETDQFILQGRLGYEGEPLTLENLGEKLNVTRERVRQRQKKYTARIINHEYWDDAIVIRIEQLLSGREEPLLLELLEVEDKWFEGFKDNYTYLANVIQVFSKNAIFVNKVAERNVVTRISQKQWDALVRRVRTSLKQKAKAKYWSRSDITQYLETSLLEYKSKELVPLLAEIFDDFLQYRHEGQEAQLISFGISVESAVSTVLDQAEGPLHFIEIARRAGKLLGREVDERYVHNATSSKDHVWLFDRGTYGLIQHCPLPLSERQDICHVVEDMLYQAPINKQWHSKEIIEAVIDKFSYTTSELTPYVLRMCIEPSPKITFLRRMVWARADSGMTTDDRINVTASFIQILEKAGEPLSGKELKRRLSEIRGVSDTMQIHENERLIALGQNLWGLSEW